MAVKEFQSYYFGTDYSKKYKTESVHMSRYSKKEKWNKEFSFYFIVASFEIIHCTHVQKYDIFVTF